MLSDSTLSIAVDADIKWIYNSARRLARRVERSVEAAAWWRLTHHLAGDLGVSLADAARVSDQLLGSGITTGRVRLHATSDESVAVQVDLDRFADGTAIALAAALYLAVPKRRGRPPTRRATGSSSPIHQTSVAEQGSPDSRFLAAISTGVRLAEHEMALAGPMKFVSSLSERGVDFVIAGSVAARYHEVPVLPGSLDLVAELSGRSGRALAEALNAAGATPRAVAVRSGFRFDAPLVRSAVCLALQAGSWSVNIRPSLPGLGGYAAVRVASELVDVGGLSFRVVAREYVDPTMPGGL